jgi:transcriptional regulator GlxA family with amidase domain
MNVVILAFNGAQLLDVVGVADLLTNGLFQAGSQIWYNLHIATMDGKPIKASNGLQIVPDCSADQLPWKADTLVLPGGAIDTDSAEGRMITDWVYREGASIRRICSICNAAFILGEAGFLDGREVTTHWRYASLLAQRFPAATVRPNRMLLRDGGVISTGGGTASFDLALALIEEDLGSDIAKQVARHFVIFPKRDGGQAQYADYGTPRPTRPNVIREVQQWVRDNLDKPVTPEQMAIQAELSTANFRRMFERDAGMTPEDYLLRQRVALAANLLAQTNLPIRNIARRCGFATTDDQRAAFVAAHGMAPTQYRLKQK